VAMPVPGVDHPGGNGWQPPNPRKTTDLHEPVRSGCLCAAQVLQNPT
jgi:hypothetical protein